MGSSEMRLFVLAVVMLGVLVVCLRLQSQFKWIGVALSAVALLIVAVVAVVQHFAPR